ncbi:hypothetical protein Pmani_031597 [Petrolisthes manimaculis]|uniref:Uncharacterized protein n=1 Tax=Petrolisthes manimaculis TaxID=1843537 RepID=A0AAE1TUN4_9EUCA|nr:hypothetical protein Pmani_031597 [Petrolisthes manimaculis]
MDPSFLPTHTSHISIEPYSYSFTPSPLTPSLLHLTFLFVHSLLHSSILTPSLFHPLFLTPPPHLPHSSTPFLCSPSSLLTSSFTPPPPLPYSSTPPPLPHSSTPPPLPHSSTPPPLPHSSTPPPLPQFSTPPPLPHSSTPPPLPHSSTPPPLPHSSTTPSFLIIISLRIKRGRSFAFIVCLLRCHSVQPTPSLTASLHLTSPFSLSFP